MTRYEMIDDGKDTVSLQFTKATNFVNCSKKKNNTSCVVHQLVTTVLSIVQSYIVLVVVVFTDIY